MSGKSPRASECAALIQALYQVVMPIVPSELVQSDEGRILEGSRLLFGFLLDKAAQDKEADWDSFPYLWSLKTVDLRNSETMESVGVPVLTSVGLVDEGYYNAYKEGGIMSWCGGEEPLEALELDSRTRRIALLFGGVAPEVTIFDSDSIRSLSRDSDLGEEAIIGAKAFSSFNHLATLCERNDFAVVPPAALQSVNGPALTLDGSGLLAVYLGRTPCGVPGKE